MFILTNNQDTYTQSGTNIDEVKRKNEYSGLTYNEVKMVLANAFKNQEILNLDLPENQKKK